jgi:hypothetical protein
MGGVGGYFGGLLAKALIRSIRNCIYRAREQNNCSFRIKIITDDQEIAFQVLFLMIHC